MADFCYECFKKTVVDLPDGKLVISKDMSFCEGCGEIKKIVLMIKDETK